MSQKPISVILLNLRESHNLKQKDIAIVLGISQQTYSNYELGKREIPLHHIKSLAEFYNISLDHILDLSVSSPENTHADKEFANGVTMSQLIYDLNLLSPSKRQELLKYLEYLKQINP